MSVTDRRCPGLTVTERISDAFVAIGWCALAIVALDGWLLRPPSSPPWASISAAVATTFAFAVIAALLSVTFGACFVRLERARGELRDDPTRVGPRLLTTILTIGLLATAAYGASRFVDVAFSSPVVRRVGVSLSVGGVAVLLLAVHERAVGAMRRLLGHEPACQCTLVIAAGVLIPLSGLWLWLTRSVWAALDWRLASPVALLLVVGIWSAWRVPLSRAKARSPRLSRAMAAIAVGSWLVMVAVTVTHIVQSRHL